MRTDARTRIRHRSAGPLLEPSDQASRDVMQVFETDHLDRPAGPFELGTFAFDDPLAGPKRDGMAPSDSAQQDTLTVDVCALHASTLVQMLGALGSGRMADLRLGEERACMVIGRPLCGGAGPA